MGREPLRARRREVRVTAGEAAPEVLQASQQVPQAIHVFLWSQQPNAAATLGVLLPHQTCIRDAVAVVGAALEVFVACHVDVGAVFQLTCLQHRCTCHTQVHALHAGSKAKHHLTATHL